MPTAEKRGSAVRTPIDEVLTMCPHQPSHEMLADENRFRR
jgi:hypothetical protein